MKGSQLGNKVDELYVVIVGSYVLIVLLDAVFMLEKLRVMGNLPMRGLLRRRALGTLLALASWSTSPCVGCCGRGVCRCALGSQVASRVSSSLSWAGFRFALSPCEGDLGEAFGGGGGPGFHPGLKVCGWSLSRVTTGWMGCPPCCSALPPLPCRRCRSRCCCCSSSLAARHSIHHYRLMGNRLTGSPRL